MIKQLAHICVHTRNLEKTLNFYCQTLGLEKAFTFDRKGEMIGCYIQFGNTTFIEVFTNKNPTDMAGNIKHFALEVTDMDAVIKALHDGGYDVAEKKVGTDGCWQSWVPDPNGVLIELHEYTEKSCQITGEPCVVDW